jgi:hypothetical protein
MIFNRLNISRWCEVNTMRRRAQKGKNGNRPITRTRMEDFLLRDNESREHIGT